MVTSSMVGINNKEIAKNYAFLVFLLFSLFYFGVSKEGHEVDLLFWKKWSEYLFKNGLGSAYTKGYDINYMPIYVYVLYFYGKLEGGIGGIYNNVHHLKLFSLLAHFVNGFVLIHLLKNYFHSLEKLLFHTLFYLLNIAILYNSYIWGQVDGLMTCFTFLSFYFGYKKRISLSLVFLVLALNFKLQNVIFIPMMGMLLLPLMVRQFSFKRLIVWVFLPAVVQFILLLPFLISGTAIHLWEIITSLVNKFPRVSINAYNGWYLLLDGSLREIPDTLTFLGMTYKKWGLLTFCTGSFFALFPLFKKGCQQVFYKHKDEFPLEKLLVTAALIPLLFFYFNTQMHERYSHAAMIFIIAHGILTRNPIPAILACTAYLLNLESLLHVLELPNYNTVLFSPVFVAALYLATIMLLFGYLYDKIPNFNWDNRQKVN